MATKLTKPLPTLRIPPNLPKEERAFYEAVKEILEQSSGQRGEADEQYVKISDLVAAGLVRSVRKPDGSYKLIKLEDDTVEKEDDYVVGTIVATETGEMLLYAPNTTSGIRIDFADIDTPLDNWLYVHGLDGAKQISEDPGTIGFTGNIFPIHIGSVPISRINGRDGWIVMETEEGPPGPFAHTGTQHYIAGAKKIRDPAATSRTIIWQYDDGGGNWVTFTPTSTMLVIGTYRASGAPLVTNSAVLFGNALALDTIPVKNSEQIQVGDLVRLSTSQDPASTAARVEIEDGSVTPFPIWIGTGAKGVVSGTPGAGALVYYDPTAAKFVVKGTLQATSIETSWITPSEDAALLVESTSAGKFGNPAVWRIANRSGNEDLSDGLWHTVESSAQVFHPSNASTPNYHKRLQHQKQMLTLFVSCNFICTDNPAAYTSPPIAWEAFDWAMEYSLDGGAWTACGAAFTGSMPVFSNGSQTALNFKRNFKITDALGAALSWSSTFQLRLRAKAALNPANSGPQARFGEVALYMQNFGADEGGINLL